MTDQTFTLTLDIYDLNRILRSLDRAGDYFLGEASAASETETFTRFVGEASSIRFLRAKLANVGAAEMARLEREMTDVEYTEYCETIL